MYIQLCVYIQQCVQLSMYTVCTVMFIHLVLWTVAYIVVYVYSCVCTVVCMQLYCVQLRVYSVVCVFVFYTVACMCVRSCVCVVCSCTQVYVCVHVESVEDILPQKSCILSFETIPLTGTWVSPIRPGWLTRESQISLSPPPYLWDYKDPFPCLVFKWVQGLNMGPHACVPNTSAWSCLLSPMTSVTSDSCTCFHAYLWCG